MKARYAIGGIAAVVVLAATLYIWRTHDDDAASETGERIDEVVQDGSGRRVLYWYDPMVPTQRFNRPGKSPFMDMQLVPKYADEGADTGVRISPAMAQNLGVRTATVERTEVGGSVTAVGRIEADERKRYALPSRVSGYVERLEVRAVGDPITKGQKIAEIYSPELLSAQQEYLALLNAATLSGAESLVQSARRRLALFGMAEREIETITRARNAQTRFGIYAPAAGYVVDLNVREGAQIEAGATLIAVADLSTVWLIADVPEGQSGNVQSGATISATLESAPGKEFSGQVEFIYPALDAQTRTARVRIALANKNGELRPGMLARVHLGAKTREVLAVPSEAVIYTGQRTVVIVREEGTFIPVEVRTGAEGDGRTEILSGLKEGEEVVTSGQFLIDSEASLSGVLARLSKQDASNARTRDTERADAPGDSAGLITATGRVISVDHAAASVTISHGPIPELSWPEMTMPFRLADPQVAHSLNRGDVIRFSLRAKPENGEYIIESATKEGSR